MFLENFGYLARILFSGLKFRKILYVPGRSIRHWKFPKIQTGIFHRIRKRPIFSSVYILCSFERRLEVLELIRPFMFYRKMKLFIENHLTTPKFLLVLHGGDGGNGAALKCLKLAKKFYQLLKNRWVSEICGYNISLKRCKIILVTGLMVLQVYSRWLSYWPSSLFACFRLYSDVVVDLTCTYYINERQNETNVHSSSYHWISSSRKSTLPFYFAYSIDFNKQRIDSTSMNLVKQNKKFYGFSQC